MEELSATLFTKLLPSGNPTIIVESNEVTKKYLPTIAHELMSQYHIGAEQVGRLDLDGKSPHLEMMGGEFCVNATRSAVAVLAHQGIFSCIDGNKNLGTVDITVSGNTFPVTSIFSLTKKALFTYISSNSALTYDRATPNDLTMNKQGGFPRETPYTSQKFYVASLISITNTTVEELDKGIHLVRLPGISHLLLDKRVYPLPQQWKEHTSLLRSRFSLEGEIACGVVWYSHDQGQFSIDPAVYVSATKSEHMETACGSGSLALALMLQKYKKATGIIKIMQPSKKTLFICLTAIAKAWVLGEVLIVATGKAYMSPQQ